MGQYKDEMLNPLYIVRFVQSGIAGAVLALSAYLTALFKRDYRSNFDPDAGDTPGQLAAYLLASIWSILALILFLIPIADRRARQGRYTAGVVITGVVVEVVAWAVWLASWASICDVLRWNRGGNVVALLVLGIVEWLLFCYTLFVSSKTLHTWRKNKNVYGARG